MAAKPSKARGGSDKKLRRLAEQTASLRRELTRINHKRRWLDERVARMELALVDVEGRYAAITTPSGAEPPGRAESSGGESSGGEAPAGAPDASWTVVQLRHEVQRRGLPGLSRASKSDLVAALT